MHSRPERHPTYPTARQLRLNHVLGLTGRTPHCQVGRPRRIRTRGDRRLQRGNVHARIARSAQAVRMGSTDRAPRSDFAAALREMTARSVAGSAAARYVARVAPLVTPRRRAVTTDVRTAPRVGRPNRPWDTGGTGASSRRLFDDALRTVMATQGRLVGEFATPQHVAALMLELADPEPGDRVYDPCFGFGELLVGAARRLRAAARAASPRDWADVQHAAIFGVEINPLSYAVGLCRTLLAGIDGPGLELTDALERPVPRSRSADGFDRILATPPWGGRTARSSSGQFRFPSRNSETLFLQHVMANLRPGGKPLLRCRKDHCSDSAPTGR